MDPVIEIKCIEHIYPDKTKIELCGLEIDVNRGNKVAVLGQNGSGKTTLLKHILGLLTPNKGSVKVFGVDPAKHYDKIKSKIGIVLQSVEEQLIGPTVLEDIIFTPMNFGYSKEEAISMAEKIMNDLDITHLKNKVIHYLSGGEKRKVALAGALVHEPELLVLDEPFSNLDLKSEKEYIKTINKLCKDKNITVIVSTHNLETISEFANTVFLISKNHVSPKYTPQEILYLDKELDLYGIEKPSFVNIVNKLKENGIDINSPTNSKDAAERINDLIR